MFVASDHFNNGSLLLNKNVSICRVSRVYLMVVFYGVIVYVETSPFEPKSTISLCECFNSVHKRSCDAERGK